jgi:nucleoside-diphosphate-sugar epimerase
LEVVFLMGKKIVITGARGFVGRKLLEDMLDRNGDLFFPICRSLKSMESIQERQGKHGNINCVFGNIEDPFCGISNPLETFGGTVDTIIHLAADTDFSQDKTDAERAQMYSTNVLGTQNVIDLAKILHPRRFLYFSTAYASGNNDGVIPDEGVVVRKGFKNYYEETKQEARRRVFDSGLPFTVVNPTIVIGDSKNGDAEGEDRMIYGYFRAMYVGARLRLLAGSKKGKRITYEEYYKNTESGEEMDCGVRLVGNPNTIKNVVPVDYLTFACIKMLEDDSSIGKGYNVGGTEFSVQEMLDSMQRAMKIKGFNFDPTFNGVTNDNLERGLARELSPYRPYVTIPDPTWDDKNLRELGVVFPKITQEKFEVMMQHYVQNYLLKK